MSLAFGPSEVHTRITHWLQFVVRSLNSLLIQRQLDSTKFRDVSGQGCVSLGRQREGTQKAVLMAGSTGTFNNTAYHKLQDWWGVPGLMQNSLCMSGARETVRLPESLGILTQSDVVIWHSVALGEDVVHKFTALRGLVSVPNRFATNSDYANSPAYPSVGLVGLPAHICFLAFCQSELSTVVCQFYW